MAFTEKLKTEVKKKAAFRCCRCHEIGVDVHHIISQADQGPDTFENAAPLCQNCHDRFGANPEKTKEITQMKDWWYDVVKEKYSSEDSKKFAAINETILKIQQTQADQSEEVQRLGIELKEQLRSLQETPTLLSPENVQQVAGQYISATKLGKGVYANFHCGQCNYSSGLLIGSSVCPGCKTPVE